MDNKSKVPDVSRIKTDVKFHRFEKDLFAMDSNNLVKEVQNLRTKYPTLSRIFFQDIVQFTKDLDSTDAEFYSVLKSFIRDSLLNFIHQRTDSIYGDMSDMKKSFDQTAAYAKYYFPQSKSIDVYTFISAFNVGNIIFEVNDSLDGLGVSMDFFQGSDFDYKGINPSFELFSNYLTRSFNKDHLLKKSWMPWTEDIIKDVSLNTLLDNMIFEGKKLYLISKIIPNIQDTVLFEYRADQLKWCQENKLNIWSFLKDGNYINSTKRNEIGRYLNPSPTSQGMPSESPGRASVFIGYDIVKTYVDKFPERGLNDMIEASAQKILDDSKYKPRNK